MMMVMKRIKLHHLLKIAVMFVLLTIAYKLGSLWVLKPPKHVEWPQAMDSVSSKIMSKAAIAGLDRNNLDVRLKLLRMDSVTTTSPAATTEHTQFSANVLATESSFTPSTSKPKPIIGVNSYNTTEFGITSKPTAKSKLVSRLSQTFLNVRSSNLQHLSPPPWNWKPVRTRESCLGQICVDATTFSGRVALLACFHQASSEVEQNLVPAHQCTCSFKQRKDASDKLVALVSLPGSGNTWVRGLLERATGICTGSMWCDPALKIKGFCGEGMRTRSTLAVKIHNAAIRWVGEEFKVKKMKPVDTIRFEAAIVIHRDPFDATVAERHRAVSFENASQIIHNLDNAHVTYVGREMFGDNHQWWELIRLQMKKWQVLIERLIMNTAKHPVLVVRYEDLKRDEAGEVRRMLEFLQVAYSEERLGASYSHFYRNHTDTFEHFTPEQKQFVNRVIVQCSEEMESMGITDWLHLKQYVRN